MSKLSKNLILVAILFFAIGNVFPENLSAQCPEGDLDNNCEVNLIDLLLFAEQWLDPPGASADLIGNNGVNIADYAILAGNWLDSVQLVMGSLEVTIEPTEARNAGAQWRVDGGAWHDSGESEGELLVQEPEQRSQSLVEMLGRSCTQHEHLPAIGGWDQVDLGTVRVAEFAADCHALDSWEGGCADQDKTAVWRQCF